MNLASNDTKTVSDTTDSYDGLKGQYPDYVTQH